MMLLGMMFVGFWLGRGWYGYDKFKKDWQAIFAVFSKAKKIK